MALKQLIIHGISRPHGSTETTLSVREEAFDINGITQEFFHEVKQAMLKRSGKAYGRFSEQTADHPSASYLKECIEGRMGFVSMSHKIAAHCKHAFDAIDLVFEGYLLIAQETLEDGEYFQISLLQHERGLYLNDKLQLEESLCLDVNALRLSARVSVDDWFSDDHERSNNAVCMTLWRGEKELSEAFTQTIGFADKVDTAAETEQFVEVLNDYTKTTPDEAASVIKRQVVAYCEAQKNENKPVVISDLSKHMHEAAQAYTEAANADPLPKLEQYVAQHPVQVAKSFMADTKQIKSLVRIAGRNDQLSMSFASSCLGDSVLYDPKTDTLTVTNIPVALKNRLKKHLT